MTYVAWLIGLSIVFFALERVAPRFRDQGVVRPGLATDLVYFVINGHFLGVAIAQLSQPLASAVDERVGLGVLRDLPLVGQFLLAFIGVDLLHYGIHNLLHRVPALWRIHRVHHSIRQMDFWGSLRFHWFEVVFYKSLTYPILALMGVRGEVLLAMAIVNTAIGHWNHANTRLGIGRLGYILNHPRMHYWHHVMPANDAPPLRNFGISLSIWDYLFGTALIPDEVPRELGFAGIDSFPGDPLRQSLLPLELGWPKAPPPMVDDDPASDQANDH